MISGHSGPGLEGFRRACLSVAPLVGGLTVDALLCAVSIPLSLVLSRALAAFGLSVELPGEFAASAGLSVELPGELSAFAGLSVKLPVELAASSDVSPSGA